MTTRPLDAELAHAVPIDNPPETTPPFEMPAAAREKHERMTARGHVEMTHGDGHVRCTGCHGYKPERGGHVEVCRGRW